MQKTIKGSLAALGAAALLTGGAGSLAYWNATSDVAGGAAITSGRLVLGAPSCGSWRIDGSTADFDVATGHIVPGDTLTRDCTITFTAVGNHLGVDLAISTQTPGFTATPTNALAGALTASAAFLVNGSSANHVTASTSGPIKVTEVVTFPVSTAGDNSTQNLTATLNTVTITATQTHDATAS